MNVSNVVKTRSSSLQVQARAALERRRRANKDTPEIDSVKWITSKFFIPELSGPITFHPYQKAVLREAHRRDESGRFVYNIVLWSDIKKSAKSCIAAAVALYRAHQTKWGSIKIIANDLKQADSRVAFYLRRAIELNSAMSNIKQVQYKTTLPNNTTIEAVPIDPAGEAGGNDDLIIFSELWAARHKAMQQMWTEMTLSPVKFGYSQRWIETYAGYSGESPILEELYETGVKQGRQLDLSYEDAVGYYDLSDLEIYANHDMLCLWNTRPRLPWQTREYYDSERRVIFYNEFNRIHRNMWISSTSKFVPDEWWTACETTMPELTRHTPMVLAADAGVSDDGVGLVGVTSRRGYVNVRYSKKWDAPQDGGKIDYLGTKQEPGLEREIVRLCCLYNVIEWRYDPYQLHDMATRLKKGVPVDGQGNIVERSEAVRVIKVNAVEFKQGQTRLIADKQLYDKIRDRQVRHAGEHDLTEHINNANARTEDGRLRIVKRSKKLKIDLAVSLSMAGYEPETEKKPNPPGVLAQGRIKGWNPTT